jgi:hypothetical protein
LNKNVDDHDDVYDDCGGEEDYADDVVDENCDVDDDFL